MTWQLPLVALHVSGILDALERAPIPNQGGYAAPETAMQFEAARTAARTLLAGGHLGVEGIFTVLALFGGEFVVRARRGPCAGGS